MSIVVRELRQGKVSQRIRRVQWMEKEKLIGVLESSSNEVKVYCGINLGKLKVLREKETIQDVEYSRDKNILFVVMFKYVHLYKCGRSQINLIKKVLRTIPNFSSKDGNWLFTHNMFLFENLSNKRSYQNIICLSPLFQTVEQQKLEFMHTHSIKCYAVISKYSILFGSHNTLIVFSWKTSTFSQQEIKGDVSLISKINANTCFLVAQRTLIMFSLTSMSVLTTIQQFTHIADIIQIKLLSPNEILSCCSSGLALHWNITTHNIIDLEDLKYTRKHAFFILNHKNIIIIKNI